MFRCMSIFPEMVSYPSALSASLVFGSSISERSALKLSTLVVNATGLVWVSGEIVAVTLSAVNTSLPFALTLRCLTSAFSYCRIFARGSVAPSAGRVMPSRLIPSTLILLSGSPSGAEIDIGHRQRPDLEAAARNIADIVQCYIADVEAFLYPGRWRLSCP